MCSFSYIEQLTTQRKDAIVVASDDAEPGHSQSLGRVSLCEDEGTVQRVLRTRVIGIVKLGDALQFGVLGAVAFLVHLLLGFELEPAQDGLHYTTFVGLETISHHRLGL